jgi:signal transduction histidine kinase
VTRARKPGGVGRRLASLGRPALAVGLLAALGWAAIQGFNRSADATDIGRLADRLQITQAAAASAGAWLDAGIKEASAVAADAARVGPGRAVTTYAAAPHTFPDALILDRSLRRVVGNARYAAPDNNLLACRDGTGAILDDGLRQLSQAALQSGAPVLRAFDDPTCAPVIAAAAATPGGPVAITLADRAPLVLRLEAIGSLADGRTYVVEASGDDVGTAVAPVSGELRAWLATRRAPAGAARVSEQGVVRAWAPLAGGWTLVVEQGSTEFSGAAVVQRSNWVPVLVVGCFALAILVVGFFDYRRRRALTRADEDRARFLAVVGHELRTPLTVLKGFVDTLSARWNHLEDGQRQTLVERLGPQVRRLHRGVDRLLIAADIQRGATLRVGADALALESVVNDVVEGFRPLAPLHTFTVDVAPDLCAVGDRKALGQALDQIVDNAVKYSPSGGAVVLRARRTSRRVELVIDDEGVGLPSDFSRIFEPLTQGEEVETRVHDEGGVGVGLYIAHALLEAMRGTVRAERRTPEPGTRIVVTLVAGPSRPTGAEQLAPSGRVHGQL